MSTGTQHSPIIDDYDNSVFELDVQLDDLEGERMTINPTAAEQPDPFEVAPSASPKSITLKEYLAHKEAHSAAATPTSLAQQSREEVERELDYLFTEGDSDMVMEEAPAPMETLVVLAKALTDARLHLDTIGGKAAILVTKRNKVITLHQHKQQEAYQRIAFLESVNVEDMRKARLDVDEAERIYDTVRKNKKALAPKPTTTHVPFDLLMPYHAALRDRLKYKDSIPGDPVTGTIDWTKVVVLKRDNAPTLNLKQALKTATPATLVNDVVEAVVTFLDRFERDYTNHLSEKLFPLLAWKVMEDALAPSNLAKEYKTVLEADYPKVETRNWAALRTFVEKTENLLREPLWHYLGRHLPS
jgi:hypothetical protein